MRIKWHDYIEERKEIIMGKPVFKGTRLTVEHVLNELEAGMSREELRIAIPNCGLASDPLPRSLLRGALKRRPLTMSSTVYLARQSCQDILRGQVRPPPF